LEQERAANFKLQPLPDVFENLLSPNGEHMHTAASGASHAEAASMDEDEVEAFEPASGSPDPAASEQKYRPLPPHEFRFAFLGGSYSCASKLCVAHAIAGCRRKFVVDTMPLNNCMQQPSTVHVLTEHIDGVRQHGAL
jgi:hypothetical protein